VKRREFLISSSAVTLATKASVAESVLPNGQSDEGHRPANERRFNEQYQGDHLSEIAFPMGGIGAGTICIEGQGALSNVSIRNHPDVLNEPCMFAAISIKNSGARVVEGPVPARKIFNQPQSGLGGPGTTYGLPRFQNATFLARFPFATVALSDSAFPVEVDVVAWSPFEPGNADDSSLPVAALEYHLRNRANAPIEGVFSFNTTNFLIQEFSEDQQPTVSQGTRPIDEGFAIWCGKEIDRDGSNAALSVTISDPERKTNCAWFRGDWYDALTIAWRDIEQSACFNADPPSAGEPSPGASVFVPFRLAAGAAKAVTVRLAWYCASSSLRADESTLKAPQTPAGREEAYRPWYSGKFPDIDAITKYWRDNVATLRTKSERFSNALQGEGLPPEIVEAVAANLSILKSPTVLRQIDGRLWGWEGCEDKIGSCYGSCTHVWNYAQAIAHLFPGLERSLRETEFFVSQDQQGHQAFRTPLPIRAPIHDGYAAADGQLGGIIKVYREWRISGDERWLAKMWPKVAKSLDYCIETWDPQTKRHY
jgi:uncharacterized protein (DUF608 family)